MPVPDKQLSARAKPAGGRKPFARKSARRHISRPASGCAGQSSASRRWIESARRPPAVHARNHGAARTGARRLAAQGAGMRRRRMAISRPNGLGALFAGVRVAWLEGDYLTMRPSFRGQMTRILRLSHRNFLGRRGALPCLFAKKERQDAAYTQFGEVGGCRTSRAPHLSCHQTATASIASSPFRGRTIDGEMYGHHHGRCSRGRGSQADADRGADRVFWADQGKSRLRPWDEFRLTTSITCCIAGHLSRTTDEPFRLVPGRARPLPSS